MSQINLREIECFVAVADHLNFSKAAAQLHLSQPPLTRHIQAIEGKLGARLFTRNTHAVALTAAGALFLEDARAILRQLDRATEAVRRMREGETVRLRLAFVGALLDEKLVRVIRRFRESQPDCQVEMADLSPSAQLAALQAGELDGGFIGAKPPKPVQGLALVDWRQEPLVLALPEEHPLARIKKLEWRHLRGQAWVMVSRQAAAAFREQFSQVAEDRGVALQIVQESDRVAAVLTMVAAGSGITVVPQSIRHLIDSGVVFRPLPLPRPRLHHVFAHRSGESSAILSQFLSVLRKSI